MQRRETYELSWSTWSALSQFLPAALASPSQLPKRYKLELALEGSGDSHPHASGARPSETKTHDEPFAAMTIEISIVKRQILYGISDERGGPGVPMVY